MLFSPVTYVGIDLTAGQTPFTYAALDEQGRLLALDRGDMQAVLAFLAGQQQALVAVCAPLSPNRGYMRREEVRRNLQPPPRPGRWQNCRVAEYLIRQHGIPMYLTPAGEAQCPAWQRNAFHLVAQLRELGFRPYPEEGERRFLEVYPHACYTVWLERRPFPKHSLEGRLQRQLALQEQGLDVPDPLRIFEEITRHRLLHGQLPLDDLYAPAELDALAAAWTAFLAQTRPHQITRLGDPEEGEVVLPVAELAPRYA